MKLEKAIEILTAHCNMNLVYYNNDLKDSIKLGIEALKCIKEHRAEFGNIPYTGLPGELPQENPLPRLAACLNKNYKKKKVK